jgi:hypothetical protein
MENNIDDIFDFIKPRKKEEEMTIFLSLRSYKIKYIPKLEDYERTLRKRFRNDKIGTLTKECVVAFESIKQTIPNSNKLAMF